MIRTVIAATAALPLLTVSAQAQTEAAFALIDTLLASSDDTYCMAPGDTGFTHCVELVRDLIDGDCAAEDDASCTIIGYEIDYCIEAADGHALCSRLDYYLPE